MTSRNGFSEKAKKMIVYKLTAIRWRRDAVWPDVGIKNSRIFYKCCPKIATAVLAQKVMFIKIAQRVYFCCLDLSEIAKSGHTVGGLVAFGFQETMQPKQSDFK